MASKLLIGTIIVVLAVSIASLVLAAITLTKVLNDDGTRDSGSTSTPTPSGDICTGGKPVSWYEDACCTRTCEKGWSKLPTVIVSLDGFRADYLMHNRTSTINRLAQCGVHTPYMYPSYPSKTFPNHYAIVTGLYPESNGIIDNNMYDPTIEPPSDRTFSMSSPSELNPQWWHGEPIWNSALLNGLKSAAYFWPGSDVGIQNMTPTYWYHYDGSTPYVTRIDQVIDWLLMDENDRPSIINVYFDEPDETGHNDGPMSSQVDNQLVMVDGFMNYFMTRLYENGLFHCVNKIILADHGMETVNNSNYVLLSDYIPYQTQEASNMRVYEGPVTRLQLVESNYTAEEAVEATRCKDDRFRVYKRMETPKRLHYSISPRIGDVVLDADAQVEIYRNNKEKKGGDHGYDYKDISMHALFLAHGPSFKQNYTVPPFQNVEVYNLLADLLDLSKRPPTNGTTGSLYTVLQNPPPSPSRDNLIKPQQCSVGQAQNCGDCSILNQHSIDECVQPSILAKAVPAWSDSLCSFDKQAIIYANATADPVAVQSLISAKTLLTMSTTGGCSILQPLQNVPGAVQQCSDIDAIKTALSKRNASVYPLQPFDSGFNTCAADWFSKAAFYDGFFAGPWSYLQNFTLAYTSAYGSIMVISGVIYDYDANGQADPSDVVQQMAPNVTAGSVTAYIPSHGYQILVRCDNAQWTDDGKCSGTPAVMSFVLPNRPELDNCQAVRDYLYMHTARIRDIELLTGLEFFPDWPFETAVRLRVHMSGSYGNHALLSEPDPARRVCPESHAYHSCAGGFETGVGGLGCCTRRTGLLCNKRKRNTYFDSRSCIGSSTTTVYANRQSHSHSSKGKGP